MIVLHVKVKLALYIAYLPAQPFRPLRAIKAINTATLFTNSSVRQNTSVERAMIGRRTSETEIDLITLLEAVA